MLKFAPNKKNADGKWTGPAILPPRVDVGDYASIDFETRSTRNIRNVGSYKYMEDRWFAILCMAWAINNDEIEIWKMGEPMPKALRRHVERGGRLHAWNAQFEFDAWRRGLKAWVQPKRGQWHCTMVRALACGLPGALADAAPALGIAERKDMAGSKAMAKVTRPRNLKKGVLVGGKPIWHTPETSPELFKETYSYCQQDVRTERACGHALPYLSPLEEARYHFDLMVADRGVPLDQELCRAAIRIADTRRAELQKRSVDICGYEPTQAQGVREWITTQGVSIDNIRKETVANLLKRKTLPPRVRDVLVCRQEGAMASTAKFAKALDYVCKSGTMKGMRQTYGAHTGRYAGRGPQLDNMPRTPKSANVDEIADVILTGESWLVESAYDNVMESVQTSIRSMIVADPVGSTTALTPAEPSDLFVADFKSIESRNLAETSGQKSTNDQWRLSDEGRGPDVYVKNGASWFNVSMKEAEEKGEYRYWGKIGELLLGYQGGTGALLRNDDKNDIKFAEIFPIMYKNADDAMRSKVDFVWRIRGRKEVEKRNITEKDWRAARFVVERWRADNPMSVKLWSGLQRASVEAVREPGITTHYRGISYRFDKPLGILFCRLMSGNFLRYPFAHLVVGKNMKGDDELQLRASYLRRQTGGPARWVKYHPYGGLLTENVIQAQCRDIMVETFPWLEEAGYRVLHTVHDEVICKKLRFLEGSIEEYSRILTRPRLWCPTMPIAVEAWSGPRYKKSE